MLKLYLERLILRAAGGRCQTELGSDQEAVGQGAEAWFELGIRVPHNGLPLLATTKFVSLQLGEVEAFGLGCLAEVGQAVVLR